MIPHSSRRQFLATSLAARAIPGAAPASIKPVYRPLGNTGLKVTTLGFGCMVAADPVVFERAADLGINHFDTARSYQGGNNERAVGGAIKGKRKHIVLSSKSLARTKEAALKDLDTSLRELGTDYLDIWSNKEIASILAITERTVKFHVSNILSKLGLERRTELVRWHEPI
jgi:aryl-alcohol dehydrogenase-like predicted oxidoreductase